MRDLLDAVMLEEAEAGLPTRQLLEAAEPKHAPTASAASFPDEGGGALLATAVDEAAGAALTAAHASLLSKLPWAAVPET